MRTIIANLNETPLTEQQISDLREYVRPGNVVAVDETPHLTKQSHAAILADTWETISTRKGQKDNSFGNCIEMNLVVPPTVYALALVQCITNIAADCRAKGIKHILPTYTMIAEGGFIFLNG